MTISPNNIKQSKEIPFRVERDIDGVYVVKNAYEGRYEYFKDRPLPSVPQPADEVQPTEQVKK